MSARRFPFADHPMGGSVASLHYFGRRLICYRGESATAYILDAYCPHLGVDVAVGGTVRGESAITEFRNWAEWSYADCP